MARYDELFRAWGAATTRVAERLGLVTDRGARGATSAKALVQNSSRTMTGADGSAAQPIRQAITDRPIPPWWTMLYRERVNLWSSEYTTLLSRAPTYREISPVVARPAAVGERVHMVIGRPHEVMTARDGDMIVHHLGRARTEVIDPATFAQRYDRTVDPSIYRLRDGPMVRAFPNITGRHIKITTPSGETRYGRPDCMIVAHVDPANPDVLTNHRDIMTRMEFVDTYGRVKK